MPESGGEPAPTQVPPSSAAGAESADLEVLRAQVAALREKVDKPKPVLERVAGVLALVALVFSLVKVPAEFLEAYVTRTNTEITPDQDIVLRYDAQQQALEVRWRFDVNNDGNRQDRIQVRSARLARSLSTTLSPEDFVFDPVASGFRTADGADTAPIVPRIFINEKEPRSYVFVFRRRVSPVDIEMLTQGASRRCLVVELDARDDSLPLAPGCFDMLPVDAIPIVAGEPFPIRFDLSLG